MTVEDSTLTATTGESIAIYAKESSLTIDNSTVTAQATADDSNVAIWCDEDLTITNDGNLTAHSGGSYGLYVTSGKASIADSLVSVTGKNGIRVIEGDLELSGATGSVTANSYALLADAGDISIAGNSTLTLEGNNGVVLVSGAGATLGFGGTTWYQWSSQKDGLSTPSIETPYAYDPTDTYLRIEPIGATYTLEVNGVKQGEYAAGANVTISADSYTDDQHFSGWTLVSGAGVSLSGASSTTSFTMPASDVSLKVTYESHVLESHAAKPPTCTEAGWEAYQTCECGYATGPVSVPATGHTYLNGVCTACGAAQPRPSRPTYPPEVPETEGGSVDVSPSRPHRGDDVTVTPEPEEGQEVRDVAVTNGDGNELEVTDNGDGTWTFEQPAGDVTVTVTFGCDGGELCPTHGFEDVDQSQWYHDAVDWAVTTGAILGYGDGTFGPEGTLARSEMATVLWRMAGRPEAEVEAELPADVPAGEWFTEAVAWSLSEGVFNGNGDGSFDPAGAVTREQAACVLYNRAQAAGEDVSARADLSRFSDASDLSGWAEDAMSWAVAEGVFNGTGEGALEPDRALSRSELAAILYNMETRA